MRWDVLRCSGMLRGHEILAGIWDSLDVGDCWANVLFRPLNKRAA